MDVRCDPVRHLPELPIGHLMVPIDYRRPVTIAPDCLLDQIYHRAILIIRAFRPVQCIQFCRQVIRKQRQLRDPGFSLCNLHKDRIKGFKESLYRLLIVYFSVIFYLHYKLAPCNYSADPKLRLAVLIIPQREGIIESGFTRKIRKRTPSEFRPKLFKGNLIMHPAIFRLPDIAAIILPEIRRLLAVKEYREQPPLCRNCRQRRRMAGILR